jgi:type II restriction enzyme
MSAIKKINKGEWSELLVIFKIILQHCICLYDHKLELYQNKTFQILTIYGMNNIKIQLRNNLIEIINGADIIYSQAVSNIISENDILNLLNEIKQGVGTTFKLINIPHNIKMNILPHLVLKSKSTNKSDVILDIENEDTLGIYNSGFSIKSHLGGLSTLINASSGTNFIYEITNLQLNSNDIQNINTIETRNKIRDRIKQIKILGGDFKFVKTEKSIMEYNLRLIDSQLNVYLADILLKFYSAMGASLKQLASIESKIYNELAVREYKIKKFLTAFALGAFPNQKYNGVDSSSGFIILKKNGDMGALHVLYRQELENYILENTILDTPSSTRHRFGTIYKEHNRYFIKLNLQIRLTSD